MTIVSNLSRVREVIAHGAGRVGRPVSSIALVAVSKTKGTDEMREYSQAAAEISLPVIFGENYLQEIKQKRESLTPGCEIHMIGPLQSNKIRDAVALCDVIQSVHSTKTLELVAREAVRIGKKQRIFLQVNIGRDERKSGFLAEEVRDVVAKCVQLRESLILEGLMTILPYHVDPEMSRPLFRAMAALRDSLIHEGDAQVFSGGAILLSMGMSDDFGIAIEEGADLVRVGTALFGERSRH